MSISAIIVTRGNVEINQICASLPRSWEILLWNNGMRALSIWDRWEPGGRPHRQIQDVADMAVFGRYAAIEYASGDVIAVQDDDCLVPWEEILDHYQPGRLVANMPESRWQGYPDSVMVGWGAIFDRDLPAQAFGRLPPIQNDVMNEELELFKRTCDIVFSMLTPRTVIDVGFQHLPWAEGPGRMFTSDNTRHNRERNAMIELCRQIRTWPDDDVRIPADA